MKQQLHVLMVEDSEDDAVLLTRELQHGGFEVQSERVETASSFVSALESKEWDVILCDYKMPKFNGMKALEIVNERGIDVPFIFVSGRMGEETAVEAMRAGAHDYVMKNSLKRLIPAIERELHEAKNRRAHAEAEKTIQFQTRLLDQVASAVIATDLDGIIFYWNKSAERLYGWKSEEALGKYTMDIIVPKHFGSLVEDVRARIGQTGSWQGEMEFNRKDGTMIPVYVSSSLLRDASGKSVGRLGVSTDITDRKRAEDALQESELRFRTFVEQAPVAIIVTRKGSGLYANSKAAKMLGLQSAEEFGVRPIIDLFAPQYREESKVRTQRRALGLPVPSEYESVGLRTDGTQFPVHLSVSQIQLSGEKANIAFIEDITERKRSEEALKHSEEKFRQLTEKSVTGIYIIQDAKMAYVNPSFARMLGYLPEEIIGRLRPADLIHPDDVQDVMRRFQERLDSITENDPSEYKAVRKDGSIAIIEVYGMLIDYQGRPAVMGTMIDISERKRGEVALQESEKQLSVVFNNTYDQQLLISIEPDGELRVINVNDVNVKVIRKMGFDVTKNDFIGKTIEEVLLGLFKLDRDVLDHTLKYFRQAVVSGEPALYEESVRLEKINYFSEVSIVPMLDKNGKCSLALYTSHDITDRKHMEQMLRESELRFRTFIEQAPLAIIVTREETGLYANSKAAQMYGMQSAEEFAGRPILELFAPQSREGSRERTRRRSLGLPVPSEFESVGLRTDGSQFPIYVAVASVELTDGKANISFITDISELRQAEETQRRYQLLSQNTNDIILFVRANDGQILDANNAAVQAYGYDRKELMRKSIGDLRAAETLIDLLKQIQEADVRGTSFETFHRRRDGTAFPVEVSSRGMTMGTEHILMSIIRDITERTQKEEAIKKSEAKFRELFDNAPIGYHELDAMGTITNVNLTELRMLGYTSDEMIGRPVWEFVGGDEASRKRVLDKIAGGLPPTKNGERMYFRKDGKPVPVIIDESLIHNQRGEISGMRTVIQDFTERKRVETALRQSEEKYRSLFEESKDTIYISTPDGKIVDINPAGIKLLGFTSKEELLRRNVARDLFVDPRQRDEMQKLMDVKGFIENFEEVLRTNDGRKITVLDTATIVRDDEGRAKAFRGTMRDITKEKLLEAELAQTQKLESIGTLASGIAHDFNNILGIILGYASLIERDPLSVHQSVDSINAAVGRGANLVRQILTFARKTEVDFTSLDMNLIIKDVVKMLRATFPKTIEVVVQIDSKLPVISADATQLHQVFLNLSVNAKDAMPGGGILRFTTELVKGSSLQSAFPGASIRDYVHVIFSDNGIGMDAATCKKIFDPFFTTKERGKGTGLGLSVVYGVVTNHSGFIDVQSEPGKGTTFNLYFPVAVKNLTATSEQSPKREETRGGTETILVVEDEEALLKLMKGVFEASGYHVLAAADGNEALALYREHKDKIALVLTDRGLPKVTGDQLFTIMKNLNPAVKVIMASGYIEPNARSEMLKAGVRDFVQKPYVPDQLMKKVRVILDLEP